MPLLEKEISRCELCGTPLQSGASALGCLNCLLLGGPNDSSPDNRFQHYEICRREDGVTLDELGRGAMGVTYRALDVNLGSLVALKVISARYSGNPKARERFHREARSAAQLRHANVASVFHFGETATGQCFYAMELVEGETLEARVRRDGPLPTLFALEVATQVARALIAAEAHGLVHRDLKPGNLMVEAGDPGAGDALVVKVIDFGLAKAVTAGPIDPASTHVGFSGTPDFASPEQFSVGEVALDVRSDIYSLGATLWYLLCGRAPFAGRTLGEFQDPPLPLEQLETRKVPGSLIALLRSLLAVDPAERPQSARELLTALQRCRQIVAAAPRRRLVTLVLALLLLSSASLTSYLSHRPRAPVSVSPTAGDLPEKSIAVLPFENLSDDKQNAYFADGMQDEILTDLGKIAGLKVISRTSVMQYKSGVARNLREIGQQLGVGHLLQGSVQRASGKVRVTAQLSDARSGAHLWGATYDRDLADVFAIQSDIAQAIAAQLQAKMSIKVKSAIEEWPTADVAAYDLYLRAKLFTEGPLIVGADFLQAAELLDQATMRDAKFFLAYCLSARTHSFLYSVFDHTPTRRDLAARAVKAAFQLRPAAAETHLARASYLYRCDLDYERARTELALAQRTLPGDAETFELMSSIAAFQGRWDESVQAQEKALELDPRNGMNLCQAAITYHSVRRFADAAAVLDRAIALDPRESGLRTFRAWLDLHWRADPRPLEEIKAKDPSAVENDAETGLELALCERDAGAAAHVVNNPDMRGYYMNGFHISVTLMQAWAARARGDDVTARKAFTAARLEVERSLRDAPDYGPSLCLLGLIDAGLGRKEDAIKEGRLAASLLPLQKDSINGELIMEYLAVIYAWTGETDLAIDQLAATLQVPGRLNYGYLRLHPFWDNLRGDPRFEKIVASLAPKGGR